MPMRARRWTRVALAGPGALIGAFVVMLGMAVWLPRGAAGIDNIVVPLALFPLIWAGLFFHAYLDPRLARVAAVAAVLVAGSAAVVATTFAQPPHPTRKAVL